MLSVRDLHAYYGRAHILHGVSLNLGSADPLDRAYLDRLDALARRIDAAWVSDHLCWTGIDGQQLHDLLPLPLTDEAVRHVAQRIARVQDRLGRRIAVENVSSYLSFRADRLPEWEFLAAVAEEADCGILLDVNNVFVSAHNHGFDAERYLAAMPERAIAEIHLAGFEATDACLVDTHGARIAADVWTLYQKTIARVGPRPTLIEWDVDLPEFAVLEAEAATAARILSDFHAIAA